VNWRKKVQAKYHRPAVYDDTVTIVTTLREKPSLRITLDYEVRRDDILLVTGKTIHAFIDRAGRPSRPPVVFVEKINKLFAG
jgi:acyl-CoA thioester hydrolase